MSNEWRFIHHRLMHLCWYHGLRLGGGWGCPAPPKIKVVSADFFLISLTTLSFLIITQLYEINHIVFFFCLLFLSENLLLLFFSSAGKPTFLFLISARKSTISNLTFCQKVYHFYSLFLSENLLFPILLSAKKCIISILCFCQKIIVHHHWWWTFLKSILNIFFWFM